MSTFSDILKELRLKHGLTQKAVAEHLDISPAAYSLYEKGKREPKYETLEKIANLFNVSVGYLVSGQKDYIYTISSVDPKYSNQLLDLFSGSTSLSEDFIKKQQLKDISNNITRNMKKCLSTYLDCDEYTEEELEEIRKFAEFVKSKRKATKE